MSQPHIVGLSGNIFAPSFAPSKTRALVECALKAARRKLDIRTSLFELSDFGDDLGRARAISDLSPVAQDNLQQVLSADALIVATPIYKGSYPGLFKHLIDLIDPLALIHRPVLLGATGGGTRHALAVEHQLRPLFAFFEARVLATAVHVSDADFTDGVLTGPEVMIRLDRAVSEFGQIFPKALRKTSAA